MSFTIIYSTFSFPIQKNYKALADVRIDHHSDIFFPPVTVKLMTLNLSTLTLKRNVDSANIVSNMLKVIVLNAQTHRQQMSDAFNDTQ